MTTFKIKSILTLENHFKRIGNLNFEDLDNAVSNMNIEIEKHVTEGDEFTVFLTVTVDQKLEDTILVEGSIITAGVFQMEGTRDETALENFTKINGPAILFPFAREYFQSTSIKCLLPPIILPPVNFVEKDRAEREKAGNTN